MSDYGSQSYGATGSHTYSDAGQYTVNVTVTDAGGSQSRPVSWPTFPPKPADADADPDTYADADANANPDTDANSNPDAHPDAHADPDADADADTYADAHPTPHRISSPTMIRNVAPAAL